VGGVVGWVALVALCVAAVGVVVMRRSPDTDLGSLAAWAGIAVFALFATLRASFGRHTFLSLFGEQNRCNSLPSLVWLATAAISVLACRSLFERRLDPGDTRQQAARRLVVRAPYVGVVAPVLVLALTAGGSHMEEMLDLTSGQELAEVAFHLGLVDGPRYLQAQQETPAITERMMRIGHYPFVRSWDLDCGLLPLCWPPSRAPGSGCRSTSWSHPASSLARLRSRWRRRGRVRRCRPGALFVAVARWIGIVTALVASVLLVTEPWFVALGAVLHTDRSWRCSGPSGS
jgi:hypothetical protein